MGSLQAQEFAHLTDQDTGLRWHLTHNHFPPLSLDLLDPAKRAIELAQDDEWDELVELPAGTTWRGQDSAPVHAIIEGWHLDAWVGES